MNKGLSYYYYHMFSFMENQFVMVQNILKKTSEELHTVFLSSPNSVFQNSHICLSFSVFFTSLFVESQWLHPAPFTHTKSGTLQKVIFDSPLNPSKCQCWDRINFWQDSPWSFSLIIWLLPLKGMLLSGKVPWSVCREQTKTLEVISLLMSSRFLSRILREIQKVSQNISDSLVRGKPPPPAVWWLWQSVAGWRLCGVIRRPPGWRWALSCAGPGPHTCWGVGCLDGHSTGQAEINKNDTFLLTFTLEHNS